MGRIGAKFKAWTGRDPYFNYCAHEANSSDEDVYRLGRHLGVDIFQATVSVICEREQDDQCGTDTAPRDLADDFADKLLAFGYGVRTFDPAGQDDIGGGCGQLWFVQDWLKKNPSMVRKSAGYGLQKVSAPTKRRLTIANG